MNHSEEFEENKKKQKKEKKRLKNFNWFQLSIFYPDLFGAQAKFHLDSECVKLLQNITTNAASIKGFVTESFINPFRFFYQYPKH